MSAKESKHIKAVKKAEKKRVKEIYFEYYMSTLSEEEVVNENEHNNLPSDESLAKRRGAICEKQEIDRKLIKYELSEYVKCKSIIKRPFLPLGQFYDY